MKGVWIAFGLDDISGHGHRYRKRNHIYLRRTNIGSCQYQPALCGVMLYVSFVKSQQGGDALAEAYGDYWGPLDQSTSFFGGMLWSASLTT